MSRQLYLGALAALAVVLFILRLTLPAYGVHDVLFTRMQQVGIFVGLAVYLLPVLVALRARAMGMSPFWGVALFLWLTASEEFLRYLAGDYFSPKDPIQPGYWIELLLLGSALLGFTAVAVAPKGARLTPNGQFLQRLAGWVALVSIIMRPSACFGSLSRLPILGDFISYSGDFLTGLIRFENLMTAIKGLFLGWSFVGNGLLVLAFAGLLMLIRRIEGEGAG